MTDQSKPSSQGKPGRAGFIPRPRHDDTRLLNLQFAVFGSQAFFVALDLGLFDLVGEAPRTVAEVAAAKDLAHRAAETLLSVCTSLQLMKRTGEGDDARYALTEVSEDYLLAQSPINLGEFFRKIYIAQPNISSFEAIKQSFLVNKSQIYGGEDLFEAHQKEELDPEAAAMAEARARDFTMTMHHHSLAPALAWADQYDLSGVKRMVDLGGGSGAHTIGAAQRWPGLTGVVFDLPVVCQVADETVAHFGLSDRVTTQVGDLWTDDFPRGDLHFYGDIFHDWRVVECRRLAEKSFASLNPGGWIMVHEVIFHDDKSGPFAAAALSTVMMMWTEGSQRSGKEIGEILKSVGFEDVDVRQTFGHWSIVSARKPRIGRI